MIVYVESNFILEIALRQEQYADAERILQFGEMEHVQLVIPAFGLSEPYSHIRQRDRDRKTALDALNKSIRDLARSQDYREFAATLDQATQSMVAIEREEMDRLAAVVSRLLGVAEVIPISAETFRDSLEYQDRYGLEPEDSLILACVVRDLRQRDPSMLKCFASRDAKAFFDPGIGAILTSLNCRYLAKFNHAVEYLNRFAQGA
ncbi:MAG TPA: hypothetical protein VFI42_10480 [Thermomicrobiaceae bacterium]|nr:hypothetical protein [Thermomicrobiaceae bacterium]